MLHFIYVKSTYMGEGILFGGSEITSNRSVSIPTGTGTHERKDSFQITVRDAVTASANVTRWLCRTRISCYASRARHRTTEAR
jgi:hypothetical protein